VIVSNPPYIGAKEYEELPRGVREYEPKEALWAGQTGVEFYEKIVWQAQSRLRRKGWLLLEVGATQSDAVCALMENAKVYDGIAVRDDYAGIPRVVKGRFCLPAGV
jgi:release factor glutamine methyltransferase